MRKYIDETPKCQNSFLKPRNAKIHLRNSKMRKFINKTLKLTNMILNNQKGFDSWYHIFIFQMFSGIRVA